MKIIKIFIFENLINNFNDYEREYLKFIGNIKKDNNKILDLLSYLLNNFKYINSK